MGKARRTRLWSLACLFLGICLVIGIMAAPALADQPNALDPQPAASGAPAVPPSVAPVIVLQGSAYDMGYQYFQQMDQLFGPFILQKMQRPQGFTAKQILQLKAYQYYIQQYTPEEINMFEGMAQAATDAGVPLSYAEVLANFTKTTSYATGYPSGADTQTLPPTCSDYAAWGKTTTDGGLICGGIRGLGDGLHGDDRGLPRRRQQLGHDDSCRAPRRERHERQGRLHRPGWGFRQS